MSNKQPKNLTDQLRQAIDDSGLTRYEIAKQTGIDESALAKFYNVTGGELWRALHARRMATDESYLSRLMASDQLFDLAKYLSERRKASSTESSSYWKH
jgi:DNA transposition AAA+ family ATPase